MIESVPPTAWAALTGAIGALAGWVSTKGKNRADAASSLTRAAVDIVNELQEEVARLRTRLDVEMADHGGCRERLTTVERRLQVTIDYLHDLGIDVPDGTGE